MLPSPSINGTHFVLESDPALGGRQPAGLSGGSDVHFGADAEGAMFGRLPHQQAHLRIGEALHRTITGDSVGGRDLAKGANLLAHGVPLASAANSSTISLAVEGSGARGASTPPSTISLRLGEHVVDGLVERYVPLAQLVHDRPARSPVTTAEAHGDYSGRCLTSSAT